MLERNVETQLLGLARWTLMERAQVFGFTGLPAQLCGQIADRKTNTMPFNQKTLNGFEMISQTAACEVPAANADHRAFVAVYPPLIEKGVDQWRVRRFEVPISIMDENFGEDDLVNSLFYKLESLEEVERLLADWSVDPLGMDAPWKCDYPL